LEIGRAAGHSVRFFDVGDSPLLHAIRDLAIERPGIRVSELASLLNLGPTIATELAQQVVSDDACCCFVCKAARVAGELVRQAAPESVQISFDAE
jgi:hypothetical protein